MTTENPPGTDQGSTDAAGSTPRPAANGPAKGLKLGVAFVAVAAVAATGGALVNGASSAQGEDTPSAQGPRGDVSAEIATAAFAEGEHRGFEDVHQDAGEDLENVLVSTDWLAERIDEGLEDNDIVLVDISEELASSELTRYVDGHIPGARQINWGTDIVQANRREFITAAEFTDLAQSLGISQDSTVVLYGDSNSWFAAYGAWLFNLYGVPDVRLLDGGLNKWEQVDGRELVPEVPQPERGTFEAAPQNFDIRAFQREVLDVVVEERDVSLIDIRFPDEYNGEVGVNVEIFEGEGATVWGHIPGAVNVPWGEIVAEDGTFKDAEEIRAIYEDAGVDLDNPVIVYCRIGERASHTWFALSQILEAEVLVYDGSWSEWGNIVGVPVQNNTGERGGLWS